MAVTATLATPARYVAGGASDTSAAFNVDAGDYLVIYVVEAEGTLDVTYTPTNTVTPLVWTRVSNMFTANNCSIEVWTATSAEAITGTTVTMTASASGRHWRWGIVATKGNQPPVVVTIPGVPTIGVASVVGTTASITFAPGSTGGGTVTYEALSIPGGLTGTSSGSPVTVSGLTAGTSYTFEVRARNSAGASAYSAPSNAVTPTVQPPTGHVYWTFPTPETTGWQHTGVTLTPYTGPTLIDTPNVVIDSKLITDQLLFAPGATNFRLTRSHVYAGCAEQQGVIEVHGSAWGLIEDVEIDCPSNNRYDRSINCDWSNGMDAKTSTELLTIRRIHTHNGTRNLRFCQAGFILVEDSFLGPNVNPGTDHSTVIASNGGMHDVTVNNCAWILGEQSFASGIIATYPEPNYSGPNWNITINGGIWVCTYQGARGTTAPYGIAAGTDPGLAPNHDFTVRDVYVWTPPADGEGQYPPVNNVYDMEGGGPFSGYYDGMPGGAGSQWDELTGTNVWSNVRVYAPGRPNHNQQITV